MGVKLYAAHFTSKGFYCGRCNKHLPPCAKKCPGCGHRLIWGEGVVFTERIRESRG